MESFNDILQATSQLCEFALSKGAARRKNGQYVLVLASGLLLAYPCNPNVKIIEFVGSADEDCIAMPGESVKILAKDYLVYPVLLYYIILNETFSCIQMTRV